ncbi:MAG TPA: hypothetical protein VI160_10710 [Gemmatimonadales bacterium]
MKSARQLSVALLVAVAAFTISCSDRAAPTAPVAPPQADLIGGLLQATGLLKCSQLPYDSTTAVIGPSGGYLTVGPHTLVVPYGALSAPTTITATLPQGQGVNAVRFQPEGLQFARPAYLTMSYANCNLLGRLLPKRIAYTTDLLQILDYLISFDNIFTKRVTGQVHHFSEYAVSW